MAKREVHPMLRSLLAVDVAATSAFCTACEQWFPPTSTKPHYKALELSCHGLPWLAGWLVFIWMTNSPALFQMQVNLYIGLLLDIILLGVLKALVRRRRPTANKPDMLMTIGVDVFSFPSGHATRAVFLTYFFLTLWPVSSLLHAPLICWATAVCISRVLLRRHHLLDVAAGVVVGLGEGLLVSAIWVGQDSSASILSWITDGGSVV